MFFNKKVSNINIENFLFNKDEDAIKNKDEYFFTYTGLDKKYFESFIKDLHHYKKENKTINWFFITIMCSIYSYLKLYMDRILNNVNKDIIYYLLLPFKKGMYIEVLNKLLNDRPEAELIELMKINEDITSRSEEIDDIIKNLLDACKILDSINRKTKHKSSKEF